MLGWGENWEKNDEKKLLCRLHEFELTLSRFVCLASYLCILFLSVGSTPLAASLYNNTKKFVRDAHIVDIVLPKSILEVNIKVYFASKTTSAFCSHALRRGGREMR